MANNSRVHGELNITTRNGIDLNLAKMIERYQEVKHEGFGHWIESVTEDGFHTDQSSYTVKVENTGRAYEIEEDIEAFLKFLKPLAEIVTGKIYVAGEVEPDITRFTIDGTNYTAESPQITFSDGEIYTG